MEGTLEALEIGVCSWSLGLADLAGLPAEVGRFGLRAVHLGVGPIVDTAAAQREELIERLRGGGLLFSAAMISFPGEDYSTLETIHRTGGYLPDDLFEARLARTLAAAELARQLGIGLLTTHAGFIPERSDAGAFKQMLERLARVADALASKGIALCLETGQERAETLAAFLTALNRPNVGVNFDPANMVLYGMGNPVDAVIRLGMWIRHVHAKDARKTPPNPTGWAADEVPVGQGDARVCEVMKTLYRVGYRGTVAIEREVGPTRGRDIAVAVSELRQVRRQLGLS